MSFACLCAILFAWIAAPVAAQQAAQEEIARLESLVANGSYALAREGYAALAKTELEPALQRWVRFRVADTSWRARAASAGADSGEADRARLELEELARSYERPEERDRTWAWIEESLGDWHWMPTGRRDLGGALPHYQAALDHWAGARSIEEARERTLAIVFRLDPGRENPWMLSQVPPEIFEAASRAAVAPEDRARALYLFAVSLSSRGGELGDRERALAALREAIALAGTRANPSLDDALFALGQMLEQGVPVFDDEGRYVLRADFEAALEVYRRIVATFAKGESAFYDRAREGIERILRPELSLAVPSAYLPGSEVAYALSWRNVASVELSLHELDLTRDPDLGRDGSRKWIDQLDLAQLERISGWTEKAPVAGPHQPGSAELRLAMKLANGAYVIEARAGKLTRRELVLVGRSALFLKRARGTALVWFCDALSSAPVAEARVLLWVHRSEGGGRGSWRSVEAETGADGCARFDLGTDTVVQEVVAFAKSGDRVALASAGGFAYAPAAGRDEWKVLAFADRSAYRPGDLVRWKAIARVASGGATTTPERAKLAYEIQDPRGIVAQAGELVLDEFGAAWGEMPTDAARALGEYSIRFTREQKGREVEVARAPLFRLEEYKLPEFEVTVGLPEENGRPKSFLSGERVEVAIQAALYAGGAVAGADVEVLVRQHPFWRRRIPLAQDQWWRSDERSIPRPWYPDEIVRREMLKTDAEGRARITIDTPSNPDQDLEYTIEARVTDASRREVTGAGSVRVARTEYEVVVEATHKLHRPGTPVEIVCRARDANDRPVAASGRLRLTRERWVEVWIDPLGREIRASEFEKLREGNIPFPPPLVPGERPWRLKQRGYESTEIASFELALDAEGTARASFTPPSEGFYKASWSSRDRRRAPIVAETALFVSSKDSRELGYRSGALEILVDKDSFRTGESAAVMLATPVSGRYVLFGVETDELFSWRVVHVAGTVELLELPITAAHVPNAYLSAVSASDAVPWQDIEEISVPPAESILEVELAPDRPELEPGEKGSWAIIVRDPRGLPVEAQVALCVADESVLAIQAEYGADPRAFFFGARRAHQVVTTASLESLPLRRLVVGANGELVDERQAWAGEESDTRDDERRAAGVGGRGRYRGAGDSVPPGDVMLGRALAKSESVPAEMAMAQNAPESHSADDGESGAGGSALPVRARFDATALWRPDLVTGADGRGQVELAYPDSLTRWKAIARVVGKDARVGYATALVRTQKPLTARLQAPRFFVIGDRVTVSGIVANHTLEPVTVDVELETPGMRCADPARRGLSIEAGGELRVDWTVEPEVAGIPRVRLSARATKGPLGDAIELALPVEPHGIEAFVARSMRVEGREGTLSVDVPAARRRESTLFSVQLSPSLAVTMLDALPYLVDYPYGCTEQTLSRFLPAAIVARTLARRGLSAEEAITRVFGGIEPESAAATHPGKKRGLEELEAVTRAGLERLYDAQHEDGGWGWWKEGPSDAYMTAYVVWGLSLARDAELAVDAERLARAARWLALEVVEAERQPELAAWILHAIAAHAKASIGEEPVAKAFAALWSQHAELDAYSRALFALAAHAFGRRDEAALLARNLANGVTIDQPEESRIGAGAPAGPGGPRTAHWGIDRGGWRWSQGAVESTAFALRALAAIDPANDLVVPATAWLVANRRGAQWSSTKDTAIAVLALGDVLDRSGELAREVEYELSVNGQVIERRKLAPAEMLAAPSRFVVPADKVRDGANEVRVVRVGGEGPLYLAARAEFFSLEDPVPARGSEIFARRQYEAQVGRPTLLKGLVYDPVPLEDEGQVASGARVEVVLTLESKNDYEYLVFEDLKPAGFEAVALQSGEFLQARELKSAEVGHRFGGAAPALIPDPDDYDRYTGRTQYVHQELRDRKVALFLDRLPQGVWEIRYELRAEVPGRFHALPVIGHAMYVPEIRCNGAEIRVEVTERGAQGE